jgi:transcriptional regulator with XRE-family HTH domain
VRGRHRSNRQHLTRRKLQRMSTRIREFRKLRGMTLNSLAQQVGTTAQTIQRLETENMTVSLDWLERIADVFRIPAAALLVTDTTASVPVLGDLDADLWVQPPRPQDPATTLSLVISAPNPVAVRVTSDIHSDLPVRNYDAGMLLIGGRIDLDKETSFEPRESLVGTANGRVYLDHLACSEGIVASAEQELRGFSEPARRDISWIAPLLMSVRYF